MPRYYEQFVKLQENTFTQESQISQELQQLKIEQQKEQYRSSNKISKFLMRHLKQLFSLDRSHVLVLDALINSKRRLDILAPDGKSTLTPQEVESTHPSLWDTDSKDFLQQHLLRIEIHKTRTLITDIDLWMEGNRHLVVKVNPP